MESNFLKKFIFFFEKNRYPITLSFLDLLSVLTCFFQNVMINEGKGNLKLFLTSFINNNQLEDLSEYFQLYLNYIRIDIFSCYDRFLLRKNKIIIKKFYLVGDIFIF